MDSIGRVGAGGPALAALALALFMACLDGGGDAESLRGTLRETCGPADGPAIALRADRTTAPTCENPADPEYQALFDYPIDSLVAGKVLRDTTQHCFEGRCLPPVIYRLEVESVDSESVRGTLEITETGKVKGATVPYKADLKRCPRTAELCG